MVQSIGIDIDDLVLRPAEHFSSPMAVVRDERLRWEDRKRILESWVIDAQERSQAEAENMGAANGRGCARRISRC